MIAASIFTSLDGIDFDRLFTASLPALDGGTFTWAEDVTTAEQKREAMRAQFERVLAAPGGYGIRIGNGATDMEIFVGVQTGATYLLTNSLIAPDGNGSRAYIHAPETMDAWREALASQGASICESFIVGGSPLRSTIKATHGVTDGDFSKIEWSGQPVSYRVRLWGNEA
jgi:hypothetical protein